MSKKIAVFLRQAALWLFVLTMAGLTICAVVWSADNQAVDNRFSQHVELVRDGLFSGALLSAVVLAAFAGMHRLMERFGVRLGAGLLAVWFVTACAWILMVRMQQRTDAQIVAQAAWQFAHGDYSLLLGEGHAGMALYTDRYFQIWRYQLGLCLPMQVLAACAPFLSESAFMLLLQIVNAALGAAVSGVLAALAQEIWGEKRAAAACMTLYLLSLPMWLFCLFVYNINLMILLCAGAMLAFARYVHTGKSRFGACCAGLMAAAVVVKPNAQIVAIALFICAMLQRDGRMALMTALAFALGKGLLAAVITGYAAQAGVTLDGGVGIWARLAMGMQDSLIAPGWYNGYVDSFFDAVWTQDAQKAQAMADIAARLCWMRENPALTAKFYKEKLLTMWLDPAYESMWMGAVSHKTGAMNGLANGIYRDNTAIHCAMMVYMNAAQNVVFGLAALGGVRLMKRKNDMAALALPVTILGGVLYHLLFEAKAQYAYPYMVYMLPLAAAGLCGLENRLKGKKP